MNFANRIKTIRLEPDDSGFVVAAGSSDVSSEYVDTAGFDGVRFLIGFGAITSGAATSIKVQQCDTSGGSYADLEGTAQTVADTNDNKCFSVEITHPRERQCVWVAHGITGDYALDNVKGSTHYHTAALTPRPDWALKHVPAAQVGGHVFYNTVK